jgi:hypothetical protein
MAPLLAGIEWLNAQPGRKRGAAVILLGLGTSLRAAGLEPYAQSLEGFNTILQGLATTSDIAGALMGIWGLIHPLVISAATAQKQAVNVLVTVQEKTPEASLEVKTLQSEAIGSMREAKAVTEAEKP